MQPGNVDCSSAVTVMDVSTVPPEQLRAFGDIHPRGNPHYWIPPEQALAVARLLATRLAEVDPAGAADYRASVADFARRLDERRASWEKRAAGLAGTRIVTFHRSWTYVARWLRLEEAGYVEPKPGVPPSSLHTATLVQQMRATGVRLVLEESFYPRNLAQVIADKGGARLAVLPSDVGASPAIRTYFDLVEAVLAELLR